MDKKKFIKDLDKLELLTKLLEDVLKQMGLSKVNRIADDLIEAYEITSLEERKIIFIVTLSELNGKVYSIEERVKKIDDSNDTIYLVTSHEKLSNYFKEWLQKQFANKVLKFWSQDNIIKYIDTFFPEAWSHKDTFVKSYEGFYLDKVKKDDELRQLLKLDDRYDKFLDIFIEPKIYTFQKDKETERLTKVRISKEKISKSGSFVISGDAGTGKSTLLKEIGKYLIADNDKNNKKNIPVYIQTKNITQSNYDVKKAVESILLETYTDFDLSRIYVEYNIILLFDTIDEFEKDIQKDLISQIEALESDLSIRYIVATRNYAYLMDGCELSNHQRLELTNFDLKQVKLFLDNFFRFDLGKSDKLWSSLQDNNILDKIPITPLTLSLVSILYEEKQYEIPATITDIYDNFNLFLLGRTSVKSNLEFLDISIKERLISLYALGIIQSENKEKKTKDEFVDFINDFFASKSITIDNSSSPELLNSLTQGTGVLFIDDDEKVSFKHDYFMEYYASLEIFKQRRELEEELIKNFTQFNWQNTAIFYTGRTRDMAPFLERLISRVKEYNSLKDCLVASSGLGYILQSLWLTDSNLRKEGVIEALNLLVKADLKVKELAAAKFPFFINIKDPDIALMNFFWFFNHFNSKTLQDSLVLAFDKVYNELQVPSSTADQTTLLYQLFCISATLSSDRISNNSKLNVLFENENVLAKPLFIMLFDVGLDIIEPSNKEELKEKYKIKNRVKKYIEGIRFYIDNPSEKLRLTSLENIRPIKNVELFTEGKTDAEIISHAFKVLTDDKEPYWNIQSCEGNIESSGGASKLSKLLYSSSTNLSLNPKKEKIVIGIYDNDAKGNQEFHGLKSELFLDESVRLRKHRDENVYAIKLPIPLDSEAEPYIQEKQNFKFFAIEHYFPLSFLKEHNMVKETSITGVFEIVGSKTGFISNVLECEDPEVFKRFVFLFKEIDEVTKYSVQYFD
ncbi:NACHT domain-containing protein [Rufibacter immobilis]|uniref:NACHT domain-containing protein n=1 Tax=Rufibacter immobilis TaxID=1348778 RepID=UPI0035EAE0E5